MATIAGVKDVAIEDFLMNPKLAGGADLEEPDVDADGTVSKGAIAALAGLLGVQPDPPP